MKNVLGGKDPEEVLQMLLKYVHQLKSQKILATTLEEENRNWDRLETDEDQKL